MTILYQLPANGLRRLKDLAQLGIDMVELLPPYDRAGLARACRACHRHGLRVAIRRSPDDPVQDVLDLVRDCPIDAIQLNPDDQVADKLAARLAALPGGVGQRVTLICDTTAPASTSGDVLAAALHRIGIDSAPAALRKVGATLLLTGPYTPMLTAGEESTAPELYRRLISLRHELEGAGGTRFWHGHEYVCMRRGDCGVVANLSGRRQRITLRGVPQVMLLATAPGAALVHDSVDLPPYSAAVVSFAARSNPSPDPVDHESGVMISR